MSGKATPSPSDGHHIRCETPRPRMAKADLMTPTVRENRAEYGKILRRARELAGMNRDEAARALGNIDPSQVTKWETGEENPQTWRYRRHPLLKHGYKLAQGEADGAVLEVREVVPLAELLALKAS